MRFLAYFILVLTVTQSYGQIKFDHIIHDFDLIRENGAPVMHQFHFKNYFPSKVELLSVQPTCGCTLADFESKEINPKVSSSITLQYDPKGRPGYFLKSAEVKFLYGKDTITSIIALKGFAISDDSKLLTSADYQSDYQIQIAPISHSIKYIDQWNVNHHMNYQTFIDDITYIIDQYGFVQVNLDLNLSKSSLNNVEARKSLGKLKSDLKRELERRKYTSNSIGFRDSIFVQPSTLDEQLAKITLYPALYANKDLKESIIIDNNIESVDLKIAPPGVHLDMIHFVDFHSVKKIEKSESYNQFVNKCVRNVLSRKELWVQIHDYREDRANQKIVKKLEKKLLKSFFKAGIDKSLVHFSNRPIAEVKLGLIRLSENLPDRDSGDIKLPVVDTLDIFQFANDDNLNFVRDTNLVQNLPAYFQQLRHKLQRIDTTNKFFISMMDKVVGEIKSGQKIDFLIESSASKAPNERNDDNYMVARIRGDESKAIITHYLRNKGLLEEDISFLETVPLVSGPEYDLFKYLPQYYYYFQYLKLIPLYRNQKASQRITPYKINFNYNNLDVLKSSPIFQNFLNQLAQEIQMNGFVKLIIESSSSKVPTLKMSKNEHLSYHRAQEAKNRIYEGIQQRGFNPTKVIFMEERILVQGPEYKNDYKENSETYKQFQYIKILPFSEIKEK